MVLRIKPSENNSLVLLVYKSCSSIHNQIFCSHEGPMCTNCGYLWFTQPHHQLLHISAVSSFTNRKILHTSSNGGVSLPWEEQEERGVFQWSSHDFKVTWYVKRTQRRRTTRAGRRSGRVSVRYVTYSKAGEVKLKGKLWSTMEREGVYRMRDGAQDEGEQSTWWSVIL